MKVYSKTLILAGVLPFSELALADWSATVTGATDYMFNGVSQTQNDPALQGSLDYAADSGFYAGSWTSNVDYANADRELDFYAGHFTDLTDAVSVDYGIAYYTYHGKDGSQHLNYPEVYSRFSFTNDLGTTEANFWYSWDYFGTGAGHVIGMAAHTYSFTDNHAIRVSVDVSRSLDEDKYTWDSNNDVTYVHYKLAYQTSLYGLDLEIAAEDTDLSYDTADARLVASVSKTFAF